MNKRSQIKSVRKYHNILLITLLSIWSCSGKNQVIERGRIELQVSQDNPHLLETVSGKPVFLNNFTLWKLIEHGTREETEVVLDILKENKFNMVSSIVLGFDAWKDSVYQVGESRYKDHAFKESNSGVPDPTKPIVTKGTRFEVPDEYDFWDHVEYVIDLAASKDMFIGLHPAWGNWFSGYVHGQLPDDNIIFDDNSAYEYGRWLGERFGSKSNVVWMIGGDRSAVYDKKTKWYNADSVIDYRSLYRSMAEGLADGCHGVNNKDGKANYEDILISYHPRKWAPNSSEWFHNDPWLDFNSIQDTPIDQMISVPHDYQLKPTKPTWLYEPVYEGAIHTWGVRYQAYQTVLSGSFGHTYGSDIWEFGPNWRELIKLPGVKQMSYLYLIAREIWTDEEYLGRIPDQSLVIGDCGKVRGRGITAARDFETKKDQNSEYSDRITAMLGRDGNWAIIYAADGSDFILDGSKFRERNLKAYWFNPRNGNWWTDRGEKSEMTPYIQDIDLKTGNLSFNPPGEPGADNDWVLVIK